MAKIMILRMLDSNKFELYQQRRKYITIQNNITSNNYIFYETQTDIGRAGMQDEWAPKIYQALKRQLILIHCKKKFR